MGISVKNINKVYRSKRGIHDITLDVKEGQIYGLLGPNGAGKTTLLKVLSGLLKSDSGTVIGNDLKHIGGMIGDTALYAYLSSMDHLNMMEVKNGPIALEHKEALLKDLSLYDYKDEKVKQFSTGMKQRLAFGMSVVTQPKVLLLDEPFSGLDIEGKILMREKIKALSEKNNMAVIISSHLIHDLDEIATHVGIMKDGYLIDEAIVQNLSKSYKNLEAYFVDKTMRMKEGA